MPAIFTLPQQQVFDQAGDMLMGAKAYFYVIGTSTPKNTYIDSALSEPHENPVIADAFGVFPVIWLDDSGTDYSLAVTDQFDVQQFAVDGLISTPLDVLDTIKTVDGAGSGLDADLLDGLDSSAFGQKAEDEVVTGTWNFAPGLLIGGIGGGYLDLPRHVYSGQHTLLYTDRGFAMENSTGGWLIPEESSEVDHVGPFPNGSLFVCYNDSPSTNQQIVAEVPATTTIRLAGTASTGTRTVAPRGIAILWYRGADATLHEWLCWGIGVS